MLYDYTCEKCGAVWEENYPMADRDKPVGKPCPKEHCLSKSSDCGGIITRGITAPGLNFEGSVTKISKVSGGFRDVLKGIKKGSDKSNTMPDV